MDVERTIEFIIDSQAGAEVRMDRAEARMDRAEARMDRADKQIQATRDLVRAGMKIVQQLAADRREARQEIHQMREEAKRDNRELRTAVAGLAKTVDRFIKSIGGRPANGNRS